MSVLRSAVTALVICVCLSGTAYAQAGVLPGGQLRIAGETPEPAPEPGPVEPADPRPASPEEIVSPPGEEAPLASDPAEPPSDVLSVGDQADPARSSLPEPLDPDTQLRLRLDTVQLEQLYEALREEVARSQDVLRLTLAECIQIALEGNQDIEIAEYAPWQSDADVLTARGEFDPVFQTNLSYIEATQTTSSEVQTYGGFSSLDLRRSQANASLGGKLRWGTTYSVAMDVSMEENTYNYFIEEWTGSLSLQLTQPLLRGRGSRANLARIRTARKAREQADQQVYAQVMTSMAEVVRAYWDLVGAVENLRVRKEALTNAERLLDINERLYEIGTVAALEVVQAKAGVATRQTDVISASSAVRDAADALKNVLNLREGNAFIPVDIVPVDRPTLREIDLNEERSIALAVENRPEVIQAKLIIETSEIERLRASNEMLPQLDVTTSFSRGGRGHYASDFYDGIIDKDDHTWQLGVQGAIPIRNRAGRGAYQRARLEQRASVLRLDQAQREAILAVRMAARNVATSRILVESNRQARALQETTLAAEEKRLRLGASTSFQVLQVQEELTLAQVQELQAIISYEKAIVDLRLAEGTLLNELGIAYEIPEGDDPIGYFDSINPFARR